MKRLFKPIITFTLFLFLFAAVPQPDTAHAQTTKINRKVQMITMKKGTKTNLKLSFTKNPVKWTSSRKSVAKISGKGRLTAIKKGTAKITASYGKQQFTFKVKVITTGTKKITVSKKGQSFEKPTASSGSADDDPLPGSTVWIPRTGSKYHSSSKCSNMKSPGTMTLTQAKASGYTACSKCW